MADDYKIALAKLHDLRRFLAAARRDVNPAPLLREIVEVLHLLDSASPSGGPDT